MRLAVATTAADPLAGVFWSAYREAGGPSPTCVFLLPPLERESLLQRMLQPFLLFRIRDLFRLASARWVGWPLTTADREAGLHRSLRSLLPSNRVESVPSLNRGHGRKALSDLAPDVLVSVGAPEIFRPETLAIPDQEALNVHNGAIPKYRGLFATFWEMYHGEELGTVTIHRMAPKVDTGEVLSSAQIPLRGPLLNILIQKKRLGGRRLADLLTGSLDGLTRPTRIKNGADNFYGWPSLKDVLELPRHGGQSTSWI